MNRKNNSYRTNIFKEVVDFSGSNPFYALKFGISSFFRACKYGWQRVTRGFSDWDEWDLDTYYLNMMIDSLKSYRKNCNGYPGTLNSFEEWEAILDRIINLLEVAADDKEENENKLFDYFESISPDLTEEKEKARQDWLQFMQVTNEERDRARKEAFALLGEWLPHLWW